MSMELLTAIQFLTTLAAYLFVTLAIPFAVLNKRLHYYRLAERILLCFMIGNFYATNLVFVLELLHMANFITIWIGLLIVPAMVWVKLYQFPFLLKMQLFWISVKKVMSGTMGIRGVCSDSWRSCRRFLANIWKRAFKHFRGNWLDCLLFFASALMVLWIYGVRTVTTFGYAASDIPVHLYWTNGLSDGKLFVAGIYPMGMHSIIYLLSTAFRLDSYMICRIFGLLQCFEFHMVALLVVKLCCKSRFAAYAGLFLYTAGNYIAPHNFTRFFSPLPQEYSMIFVFPTVYYAFRFFKQRREELQENAPEKDSLLFLSALAMSFSLALSAHFYGAMVAAVFCVGVGIGHVGWIFKRPYLTRILAAGMISVAVSVLPMAVAYATGTPLQASLFWATSMMSGFSEDGTITIEETPSDGSISDDFGDDLGENLGGDLENSGVSAPAGELPGETTISFAGKIKQKISNAWTAVTETLNVYTLNSVANWYSVVLIGMIVFLVAAGGIFLIRREYSYGAVLLSSGAIMGILTLMLSAKRLGIPVLMGADRLCIFYAYSLILLVGLSIDACAYMLTRIFKKQWFMQVTSLLVVLAVGIGAWQQERIRAPLTSSALESNEAITCVTNIIATEEDYKWTIFSANDETNMVYGHGFHYELITFLDEIRWLRGTPVTVPTEVIYFFIEKIPLDYVSTYEGSGREVSIEGAEMELPHASGISIYQGENRWVIMSHMYYWAQEFQRLYPNEMKVYLETDQFVCYRLEQNTYSPYDLAIDYGFN